MAKAAKQTATRSRKTATTGDETPETKRGAAAQKDAADKLFDNADDAAMRGLPVDMTVEQHENHVRRQALGF